MSAAFRRVVVPLDGTPLSEAILPVAVDLAAACQATIVLLHIVEAGAPATVHGHPHLAESAQADAYLEMVAARYRSTGIQFETHVHTNRERDVAQSIARHVGELHADLIAMSTHGPGGLRAFLTASIGQQALRHVSIPVLLMRPAEQPFGSYHCRVIGVPLDGTAMAETALPLAMALAERTGSELILVRVVPTVSTIPSTHGPAATLLPAATSEPLRLEQDEVPRKPHGRGPGNRLDGGGRASRRSGRTAHEGHQRPCNRPRRDEHARQVRPVGSLERQRCGQAARACRPPRHLGTPSPIRVMRRNIGLRPALS